MVTLYLAHSLSKRKQIRKWQLFIEKNYNIKFMNPFYNNQYERAEIEKLDAMKTKKERREYQQSWDIKICKRIVDIDLSLVRKSDGVVSYFQQPTIGTCQEIIMAAYVYRIPVYIIAGKFRYHPWLITMANESKGKIFKNRTEFKKWLIENGYKRRDRD